jgi:hypothetical protein
MLKVLKLCISVLSVGSRPREPLIGEMGLRRRRLFEISLPWVALGRIRGRGGGERCLCGEVGGSRLSLAP